MSDPDEGLAKQAQAEASQRSNLLTEIGTLKLPALNSQKSADGAAAETVDLKGPGARQCIGYRLAKFWMEDRGSALVGADYLLADGTFATSFEGGALAVVGTWDQVNTSRLEGIRDGLRRLSVPAS